MILHTVEWRPSALDDLRSIAAHIAVDSRKAAALVLFRIEQEIERLRYMPEIGRPGRRKGTRELIVRRTRYVVAYRWDGEVVHILRVVHGARRWPRYIPL